MRTSFWKDTLKDVLNNKPFQARKEDRKYVVLMGKVGSGKTTLFNKITNSTEKTCAGADSITRKVIIENVSYGNTPVTVADTPGLVSVNDRLHHALSIRDALGYKKVNTIAVCVKYERHGPMLENVADVLEAVDDYMDYVSVVVTHTDLMLAERGKDGLDKDKNDLRRLFLTQAGIKNMMFVAKDSSPAEICTDIAQQCSDVPCLITILKSEIYSKFNLGANVLLKNKVRRKERDFNDKAEAMKKAIDSFKQEDADSFYHGCMIFISTHAQEVCDEFARECGDTMTEMENYAAYISLKKKLAKIAQDLRVYAQGKMSFSLLDSNDPRNMFRKCNYCGLIWVKVEGCDGVTTCGNRPSKKDIFEKPIGIFSFTWAKNALNYIRMSNTPSISQAKDYAHKGTGFGCGNQIKWSELPILSPAELKVLTEMGGNDDLLASHLAPPIEDKLQHQISAEANKVEIDDRSNK